MRQRKNRHHVTIKEVAGHAGVSQMTVSRVINKRGLVRDSTRRKVENAVRELNYRPNLSARRLAGGKSLFVGLLYHNPSPGYLTRILVGGLNACRDRGHHLVIEDLGRRAPYREPVKTAEYLGLAGLDGVIITPPLSNHRPFVEAIEALGITVILIAPENIHSQKLTVAMDDALAVEDMLNYIIGMGHSRIAIVKGPPDHPSSHHRFGGFMKKMENSGIPINPVYICEGDFTYRSGVDAGHQLLNRNNPPTAIFACNDDMAAGAVAAANMRGLYVPDDLSVAGFDDTEIATNIWPELTTIKQPIAEMSSRAVDLLTAYVQDDAEAMSTFSELLQYELVIRESVSKPSK